MALDFEEGLKQGSTGGLMGLASGTPHGGALGFAGGFLSGLFGGGGGDGKKRAARMAAKQHKYNKKVWKFNNEERKAKERYNIEGLQIKKRNDRKNTNFQDRERQKSVDEYNKRETYRYDENLRAYNKSLETSKKQIGFNAQSANFARKQQDRYNKESLQALQFEKDQMLLDYSMKSAGLEQKKIKLELDNKEEKAELASKRSEQYLEGREKMSVAQRKTQQALVESLEAKGKAQASGSGRSAAKAMQAAIAKAGVNEASIADELMFGLEGIDIGIDKIAKKSAAMRAQLTLDKILLREAKENLDAQKDLNKDKISKTKGNIKKFNKSAKQQINFEKRVADASARAKVMLMPEMSPLMDNPEKLPRPEYQDVYIGGRPPKPQKFAQYQQSAGTQLINSLPELLKAGLDIYNSSQQQGYQQNTNTYDVSGLNITSDFTQSMTPMEFDFSTDVGSYGSDIELSPGDFMNSDTGFTSDELIGYN